MDSLGEGAERSLRLTADHLSAIRRGMALYRLPDPTLEVSGESIDDLIHRSGDSYIWRRVPGAAYRESALLRERMGVAGVGTDARRTTGLWASSSSFCSIWSPRVSNLVPALGENSVAYPISQNG